MTLAEHLLEDITKALADGRTVYVATALKATKVTPSTAASWEASGHQLFKLDKKGDLTMAKGRKYVPITFCSGQYLYCTVKITQ